MGRIRKKKPREYLNFKQLKQETRYDNEFLYRKGDYEVLKERIRRLVRNMRKMKAAYEQGNTCKICNGGERVQLIENSIKMQKQEISIERADNSKKSIKTEEKIADSAKEPETRTPDDAINLPQITQISLKSPPKDTINEETNFCRETAVGILFNSPILRNAILNETEPDQRDGDVAVLYEAFTQMTFAPHFPDSRILKKMSIKGSLSSYFCGIFLLIKEKVPHLPTEALKRMSEPYRKVAENVLSTMRSDLLDNLQVQVKRFFDCKCEIPIQHEWIDYFVQNTSGTLTEAIEQYEDGSTDDDSVCDDCEETREYDSSRVEYIFPEYVHIAVNGGQYSPIYTIRGFEFTLAAAAFQMRASGEFFYIIRKDETARLVNKQGIKALNYQELCCFFENPEYVLRFVQLKKISCPLDPAALEVIKKLSDPPARFQNIWSTCVINSISNAFLCMPAKLREKLKELEVPKDEQPHNLTTALLWEIIDGAEKIAAKQKDIDWKRSDPYPDHIISKLMLLGVMKISPPNEHVSLRLLSSNGIDENYVFNTLFERHSTKEVFKSFASFRCQKVKDGLKKEHLESKSLNITVFDEIETNKGGSACSRYAICDKEVRPWNIGDLLLVKPIGSLLLVFVLQASVHVYLVVSRPQNDVIIVNDDRIHYHATITDGVKALEVDALMCMPKEYLTNDSKF